jgi:hypothetical protein
MKIALQQLLPITALLCAAVALSPAQIKSGPAATTVQSDPIPFEILGFKIISYYNPLLERSRISSADERELPRTPSEQVSNAQRTTGKSPQERANEIGVPPGAAPTIKVISPAEWVNLSLKNTSAKPIKTIVWDFAFARLEAGKLVLRYEVASQVEIKPGAKKTIRQPLPPGATRCQVINVREETTQNDKAKAFESVCGRGFNDPALLKEKQEPVSIKRIEYADGSVWQHN